jgi:hypothetical protein
MADWCSCRDVNEVLLALVAGQRGRLTLIWPDFAIAYLERNGRFSADAYERVSREVPSS